ncbi:MAG: hypothetical protein LQ352_003412 [Teloschistes flavicans]|nr:MAG: hypothetical protein LQ352_003412 [Teloschistes flavicans]
MISALPSFPAEILVGIAAYLDSDTDYVHFSQTHPIIRQLLTDKHTIAKALQRIGAFSEEVRRVAMGELSPKAAMRSIYNRKNAVAAAQPASCIILGQATTFLYRNGLCAYVRGNQIRVLNVHNALDAEAVIDCSLVGPQLLEVDCRQTEVELCNLQLGLLTIIFHGNVRTAGWRSWLIVLDVDHYDLTFDRFIFVADLWTADEIIVRNNEKHLCVISPIGLSANGRHREWICKVWDMEYPTTAPLLLQIPDLGIGEIGHDLVFEIFGNYLYIVSTQAPYDLDEPEWMSYYNCFRFPLDNAHLLTLETLRSWRRHHSEGPINNLWTSLSLQQDETLGELIVIEARKEWTGCSSTQRRTWYKHVLPSQFTTSETAVENDESLPGSAGQSNGDPQASATGQSQSLASSNFMVQNPPYLFAMPPNEAARDAEASDKGMIPGQQPISPRMESHMHSEYPTNGPMPEFVDNSVLAKSKHRTYELRAQAFIDLLVDDRESHRQRNWDQQIRLRVGSRRESSPLNDEGMVHKHLINPITGKPIEGSEVRFHDTGIHLWPPTDAPMVLQDLLNGGRDPRDESSHGNTRSKTLGEISAISDERSILYLVKKKGAAEDDWGRLILINFDKHIRFQHEEWSPRYLDPYGRKASTRDHPTSQLAEQVGVDGIVDNVSDISGSMDVDGKDEQHKDNEKDKDGKKDKDSERDKDGTESDKESSDSDDGLNPAPGDEDYDLFSGDADDRDDLVELQWFTRQMALWTGIQQGFRFFKRFLDNDD